MPWTMGRATNPFSVQHHGPDECAYLFTSERQRKRLMVLLEEAKWRMELVAGHGVGKSTLLMTLRAVAERDGMRTVVFRCSDEARSLSWCFWRLLPRRGGVVFLDGGESCPRWQLWLLAMITRRRSTGLILTSVRPLGIARPLRLMATVGLVCALVEQLIDSPLDPSQRERVTSLLRLHRGSVREVIFQLYNEWEDNGFI